MWISVRPIPRQERNHPPVIETHPKAHTLQGLQNILGQAEAVKAIAVPFAHVYFLVEWDSDGKRTDGIIYVIGL